MKICVHLRKGNNATNARAEAVAIGLEKLGHKIVCLPRTDAPHPDAELVIQTGFAKTAGLTAALERGIPYIVAEAPFYRLGLEQVRTDTPGYSSWGYGGLAGGAWWPEAPSKRPNHDLCPTQRKVKPRGDKEWIIAQKPTDHSLRGVDHNEWLLRMIDEHPNARVRPHPLMSTGGLEPVEEMFEHAAKLYVYTSTLASESLIHGVPTHVEHWGCIAHDYDETYAKRLRWKHGPHSWLISRQCAEYVMSGFEEARERAQLGQQETPREKTAPIYEYDRRVVERYR